MRTMSIGYISFRSEAACLNATDTKCIDLVLRVPPEGATAGWLSDMSGLTTGAITHILDRLEKRGFVQRQRDTQDRRKIFIRVRQESRKPLIPKKIRGDWQGVHEPCRTI